MVLVLVIDSSYHLDWRHILGKHLLSTATARLGDAGNQCHFHFEAAHVFEHVTDLERKGRSRRWGTPKRVKLTAGPSQLVPKTMTGRLPGL